MKRHGIIRLDTGMWQEKDKWGMTLYITVQRQVPNKHFRTGERGSLEVDPWRWLPFPAKWRQVPEKIVVFQASWKITLRQSDVSKGDFFCWIECSQPHVHMLGVPRSVSNERITEPPCSRPSGIRGLWGLLLLRFTSLQAVATHPSIALWGRTKRHR